MDLIAAGGVLPSRDLRGMKSRRSCGEVGDDVYC